MAKGIKSGLRTVVTFTSSTFKTVDIEDKQRFRGTFGDDVAIWLMMEMQSDGVDVVAGLHQADAGWFYAFRVEGKRHLASINLYDSARFMWQVTVERDVTGPLAWLGGRRRGVRARASQAMHRILDRSGKAANIWWYLPRDLKPGSEGKGSAVPLPST